MLRNAHLEITDRTRGVAGEGEHINLGSAAIDRVDRAHHHVRRNRRKQQRVITDLHAEHSLVTATRGGCRGVDDIHGALGLGRRQRDHVFFDARFHGGVVDLQDGINRERCPSRIGIVIEHRNLDGLPRPNPNAIVRRRDRVQRIGSRRDHNANGRGRALTRPILDGVAEGVRTGLTRQRLVLKPGRALTHNATTQRRRGRPLKHDAVAIVIDTHHRQVDAHYFTGKHARFHVSRTWRRLRFGVRLVHDDAHLGRDNVARRVRDSEHALDRGGLFRCLVPDHATGDEHPARGRCLNEVRHQGEGIAVGINRASKGRNRHDSPGAHMRLDVGNKGWGLTSRGRQRDHHDRSLRGLHPVGHRVGELNRLRERAQLAHRDHEVGDGRDLHRGALRRHGIDQEEHVSRRGDVVAERKDRGFTSCWQVHHIAGRHDLRDRIIRGQHVDPRDPCGLLRA